MSHMSHWNGPIYKSFVRPHLDYGDIIYDQPNNESPNQKVERIQYNAALQLQAPSKEHHRVNYITN